MENEDDTFDKTINAIKPIHADTVHKICSGQVVFSLAVAVKELVENSLDAGATRIDIRFKNYGIDLIEVVDNGTGVTEENFSALTLKYHTSKLSDYSDLLGVSSFGFRGEALSSLCSLANVSITTRHQTAEYATKIVYDHNGHIINKTPCSRQVGTTVTLKNLFCSLPVRQKEFHKNVKREFNKMTNLLYAYCLISVGVNITCSNQTNSNSKSLVVTTQGSTSYNDNIACIFGPKQLQNLLEIKTNYVPSIKENVFKGLSGEVTISEDIINIEDTEIDLSEDSNEADDAQKNSQDTIPNSQDSIINSLKSQGYKNIANHVELTGFISSCAHGSGRSSTDRQFYYINSRPCEPTKIIKLVNEIYRQFNPHQYAFVFLNIILDRTSVDVNVTPDKRKLFLAKEKSILDVIKGSITKLFENIPKIIKIESLNSMNTSVVKLQDIEQPRVFNSFMQQFSKKTQSVLNCEFNVDKKPELKRKSNTLLDFSISKTKRVNLNEISDDDPVGRSDNEEYNGYEHIKEDSNKDDVNDASGHKYSVSVKDDNFSLKNEMKDLMYLQYTSELPNTQIRNITEVITEKSNTIYCKTKRTPKKSIITNVEQSKKLKFITDKEELGKCNRKSITMKTSMDLITKLVDMYKSGNEKCKPEKIKFRSEINPAFNKKCEEELSREINKESFTNMMVIGQFNLGFIITRLGDDLFIIDQHATDEIYNFEMLQRTTELTSQKLVIPQQLELSGVNEEILIDNLDVFKKNGFTFEINENGLPTRRVKLLTIPMSKNWIFGKDDIEELLFMLRENQSEHCRPSRVRAMFASRACRKSVMIGTALSKADMKTLVNHMADIDKPWNCPHGRPTIRHLVNLSMVYTK